MLKRAGARRGRAPVVAAHIRVALPVTWRQHTLWRGSAIIGYLPVTTVRQRPCAGSFIGGTLTVRSDWRIL
jgi:hypothetical protein